MCVKSAAPWRFLVNALKTEAKEKRGKKRGDRDDGVCLTLNRGTQRHT